MTMNIYAPGALPADKSVFDVDKLKGSWSVAWSTLPMWRKNRDVTITYTQDGSNIASDVAYRPRTSPAAGLSHVRGTERPVPSTAGCFVWRGDGWLCWCTSHWEVRGAGVVGEVEWCVISFAKTLFTPAGIDILIRTGAGELPAQDAVVADLVRVLQEDSGEDIRSMAGGGEVVPR